MRITEANQNFSRVARLADEFGAVVVLKGSAPRYLLLSWAEFERLRAGEGAADCERAGSAEPGGDREG